MLIVSTEPCWLPTSLLRDYTIHPCGDGMLGLNNACVDAGIAFLPVSYSHLQTDEKPFHFHPANWKFEKLSDVFKMMQQKEKGIRPLCAI